MKNNVLKIFSFQTKMDKKNCQKWCFFFLIKYHELITWSSRLCHWCCQWKRNLSAIFILHREALPLWCFTDQTIPLGICNVAAFMTSQQWKIENVISRFLALMMIPNVYVLYHNFLNCGSSPFWHLAQLIIRTTSHWWSFESWKKWNIPFE